MTVKVHQEMKTRALCSFFFVEFLNKDQVVLLGRKSNLHLNRISPNNKQKPEATVLQQVLLLVHSLILLSLSVIPSTLVY